MEDRSKARIKICSLFRIRAVGQGVGLSSCMASGHGARGAAVATAKLPSSKSSRLA